MVFMFAKHSHFDCFLRLLVDAFTSFSCFFAPGGSLGAFWEPLGSLLCAFWGLLGVSWKPLGLLLVRLGRLFEPLGASWVLLAASWAPLGASWCLLGASRAPLGASWAPLGSLMAPLGGALGASWCSLGPIFFRDRIWVDFWNRLGVILGRPERPGTHVFQHARTHTRYKQFISF